MIVKERKLPISIIKTRALLRRIPQNHQLFPTIREDMKKREAGYKGELSIDYHLGFLDSQIYYILNDLRLPGQNGFFQLDTLILSTKMILTVEVENIAGTLYFDPTFNQLIRTKEGVETGFGNPLSQIKRHETQLNNWLTINNLPNKLPIHSLVVISYPQTIIRTPTENRRINNKVLHAEDLPLKVNQFQTLNSLSIFTDKELKRMIKLLKKQHVDPEFPILNYYHIGPEELIKGVVCANCNHYPLKRIHGSWFCTGCKTKDKKAHLSALEDYSLLISPFISNSQCRHYLGLESAAVATRLLHSMKLTFEGINKGRVYNLNSYHFERVPK
jgi:hypothetical protein